MATGTLEKIIASVGYLNGKDFLIKFVIPIFATSIVFSTIVVFLMPFLPRYYGIMIFAVAILFIIGYPITIYSRKKVDINEKIHLMITYLGTISTLDISRSKMFLKLSEKKDNFREIANVSEKIYYFAKRWNLGFSKSARKIATLIPSDILADFLDRFAIMMDFGQDLRIFLMDEQDAVMDDFASEYKKSLENIKLIQEVFVSLTMTIGFVMATALLLPLVAGYPMEKVVQLSLVAVIIMDIFMYVFVRSFIPNDPLMHNLPIKDRDTLIITRMFYVMAPLTVAITMVLLYLDYFNFLFNFAIGATPLIIIGIMAQNIEQKVFSRDLLFPSYIRALGSAVEVKMGAVVGSLRNLQVHDFGVLNDMSVNLYRRLRMGSDKVKAWKLFAAESGSYLIAKFSEIFSEGVYMGGNAEKIGQIISKNFKRLISLRKQRLQLSSSVRGAFYGSLIGFASASYISAKITQLLAVMFTSPFSSLKGTDSSLASVISSIAPASALTINFEQVAVYIGIMVIFHSLISSLIIKIIEGGNSYASLFDLVVMLWLGAVISWAMPAFVDKFLPNFTNEINDATNVVMTS